MPGISSVLVANRGEIACRVMRTARDMGLETIAVFSDDDVDSLHVHVADRAVHLPGKTLQETYLSHQAIVSAAQATGASCVHPGYGFLSEDPGFARHCETAGIRLVGPSAAVIEQMALKDAAKGLAEQAGVPVLEGARIAGTDPAGWLAAAASVGYPLIVKAVAGGGGRAMHVASDEAELETAIATAQREATSLFGSGKVILERYLPSPRHIEIQVIGDTHGNAVHVFERECSIQRRHQKIIEESPSTAMTPHLRARMGRSAVDLVKSLGYVGVGTVEFLLDDSGEDPEFFFLEMNTRLQVEHTVTEEVSGLDLVRVQLEIADGQPLSVGQDDLTITGHAIEARLYAEDAANAFRPCPGEILEYLHPYLRGVRFEDGVRRGSQVSPRYDALLSKVVARGDTRREAIRRLNSALRSLRIHGVTTNRDFLLSVISAEAFEAGDTTTDFLDRNLDVLTAREVAIPWDHLAALVAVRELGRVGSEAVPLSDSRRDLLPQVWSPLVAFELISGDDVVIEMQYRFERDGEGVSLLVRADEVVRRFTVRAVENLIVRMSDGVADVCYEVAEYEDATIWVNDCRQQSSWRCRPIGDVSGEDASGEVRSMLPGTVVAVHVQPDQPVQQGDQILVLEAMKMEHAVTAPRAGRIRLHVGAGDFVQSGVVLVEVE